MSRPVEGRENNLVQSDRHREYEVPTAECSDLVDCPLKDGVFNLFGECEFDISHSFSFFPPIVGFIL